MKNASGRTKAMKSFLLLLGCCLISVALGYSLASNTLNSYAGMASTSVLCVAIASLISYITKTEARARRREVWSIHDAMVDPLVCSAILRNEMPPWLTFPSVERSDWLAALIGSLWTNISRTTEQTLTAALTPVLTEYRPPFLTKLYPKRMSLGTQPFNIMGVQTHTHTDKHTLLDLHIQWNGNPDLRICAGVGPVEVVAVLSNFQLKGTLRVVLGPHCDAYPCFAAVSLSFVGKPTVDFKLAAAKVPFDAIPGLSQWLDSFVRDTLVWLMVYPKRKVIPILDAASGVQLTAAEPTGRLTVTITSCTDLPKKGFFSTTSPYVTATVTSSPKVVKRTKTQSKTREPIWRDEKFSFLVYNVPNERLILTVFHDSHENAVGSKMNVMKDKALASVELFVNTLMSTAYKKMSQPLTTAGTGRNGGLAAGGINFTVHFKPFVADESDALEPTNPNGAAVSRNILDSAVPVGGLLIVTLDRCNDLKKADLLGASDPYVVFTLGGSRARSETVMKNLNPTYDDAQFELEFEDAAHDTLKVQVYDYDRFKGFAKGDDEIGNCRIPLAEVARANKRLKSTWPLSPQGTISLELKLLTHGKATA